MTGTEPAGAPGAETPQPPAVKRAVAPPPAWGPFNVSLVAALLALAAWVLLVFVLAVPAGWPHLFLAAGVILLIRRVVTGPAAW